MNPYSLGQSFWFKTIQPNISFSLINVSFQCTETSIFVAGACVLSKHWGKRCSRETALIGPLILNTAALSNDQSASNAPSPYSLKKPYIRIPGIKVYSGCKYYTGFRGVGPTMAHRFLHALVDCVMYRCRKSYDGHIDVFVMSFHSGSTDSRS